MLALGAVTSYHDIPGAKDHSLSFKTLADANTARDRVDQMAADASILPPGEERQKKLSMMVAGGGYTGVETIAALYLRLKEQAKSKGIQGEELSGTLVEPKQRLMQEMPEALAAYSRQQLEASGIRVLTGVGVSRVELEEVTLANGEIMKPSLLIWDTGIEPSPLLKDAGVPTGKHHGVVVDSAMRVAGLENVWALGDCAEIPTGQDGKTYATTAQNAVREGKQLALNIRLVMQNREPRPFRYKMLGELAVVSKYGAVANVLGFQVRGVIAWAMWWVIYIAKLPGMRNRREVVRNLLLR